MTRQEVEQVGATMGLSFGILAAVVGCFNLAFIIPDLIYAYGGSTCVTTFPAGFSLTLSKWLEVDAYTRIGIVGLFFIVAVVSCISAESGVKLAIFAILALLLYSVFTVAWMIVGAIMFWGRLNPTGVCTGGVQAYMYALLIISFIGVCCNCLISSNSRNNTQKAYSI
jgi:hypothetical protein